MEYSLQNTKSLDKNYFIFSLWLQNLISGVFDSQAGFFFYAELRTNNKSGILAALQKSEKRIKS